MSKKQAEKKKQKIIEDKTFGLKNKNKSAKVKQYVQTVEQQVKAAGSRKEREQAEKQKLLHELQKKEEKERKEELALLFKQVVIQPKVPFGVDPKTMLCAYFKAGQCTKGTKCKFSHDLAIERKVQKANLYQDQRDGFYSNAEDETMENWDQTKLEEAVKQKDVGRENLNKATEIVCKYFIEAIEDHRYGWFWEWFHTCKYRHALPPGFVLKKKESEEEKKARLQDEKENAITIEDFLETERHLLGANVTPVTAESFAKWKADRKAKERMAEDTAAKKKAEDLKKFKAGIKTGVTLSGKDLFDFNPEWANEGEEEDAMEVYQRQESDGEEPSIGTAMVQDSELFESQFEGLESDQD